MKRNNRILEILVVLAVCAAVAWFVARPGTEAPDDPGPTPERNHKASKADLEIVTLGDYSPEKLARAHRFLADETRLFIVTGPRLELPSDAFVGSRTAYLADVLLDTVRAYKGNGRPPVLALTRIDLVASQDFDDPHRMEAVGEGVAVLSNFRVDLREDGWNDSALTKPRMNKMLLRLEGLLWGKKLDDDPSSLYYGGLIHPWDLDRVLLPQG